MLSIILVFLAGCVVGYILKSRLKVLRTARVLQDFFMALLLILLGYIVGNDPVILSQIPELGFQALVLTVGAISGSILFAIPFGKVLGKLK